MANFSRYQGIGATSQRVRIALVEKLSAQGLTDPRVKAAIQATPRHFFIDEAMSRHAYENVSLPIGFSQTISQPQVVALMTQAVVQKNCDQVLEIGTGCGYQTAILAQLFKKVHTVERIDGLYQQAKQRLQTLAFDNITFNYGDGLQTNYPERFFDAIVVTAAIGDIPISLLKKLTAEGQLIAPVGDKKQMLMRYSWQQDTVKKESLGEVSFVPLLSGAI